MRAACLLVMSLLLLPAAATAQSQTEPNAPSPPRPLATTLSERLAPTALSARLLSAATEQAAPTTAAPELPVTASRGHSIALMVTGGALFVAGALTGGDAGAIMMVAGAGIGAYGIYLHFR